MPLVISNPDPGLPSAENWIRELSQEFGRRTDCMEWPREIDARAKKIPPELWPGGEFGIVELRKKELLEVEGDPAVQRGLGERIKNREL